MTHWKLILAYDGTTYHGWQIQPVLPTVQGTLADAIHHVTGERVLPQGSGRTDTGVHALAQVASFAIAAPIPAANFHRALNRCLPPSIRVLAVETVSPRFHARHSALRKTYEYRIFPLRAERPAGEHDAREPSSEPDRICPPTLAPYVWPCPWPLSLGPLNQAASHILGTHDFTSFAAADPDETTRAAPKPAHLGLPDAEEENAVLDSPTPRTAVRTIHCSNWTWRDGLLVYRVTGSGFLHHMVRNLVGTFVQAGARRLEADAIPQILAARSRSVSGPTAPATGLFLVSVDYPESSELDRQTSPEQRSEAPESGVLP